MKNQKVWFVTGASKGLGLSLVKKLLQEGYHVAATSRNKDELSAAVGDYHHFLPLEVDLTSEESINKAVQQTTEAFGTLDVLVNNAGYGLLGSLEELSDEESRKNFDINVFGLLNVIRAVMPVMRENRNGHIFNISSIGGYFAGFPGWGIYCATKFAVAGLTEALAAEIRPFNVHATVVYPGYFRTEFLSGSIAVSSHTVDGYTEVRNSQELHKNEINGNQPGDPDKAADALIQLSLEENPVVHLFLGQDAFDLAKEKIRQIEKDMETAKDISVSTGFEVSGLRSAG
ncbi:3-phenylpropionate-dihydrodiol/cinnamic acid-dihydrodiol dehydrogenase [Dyadobacter sp. CECT 9275]|uniref:3-phenylpropionate-dihydrodiol/cinnamic acid-dihydrodiol dehydrogenase n=1 Tax=Dyadobacter helix TaxID=2822344 RepID=A0A916NCK2_9BACT|nr:oxidoreductase [Dyadobacter sp. CECT 9275]CAG5004987.1 3-phenylpropionate-dihydrodiol/cinnamic acid-dihydrodiol dehydrogenase [Dyadobacter sp. CECT 9275]